MKDENYITKAEAVKKGYKKRKGGGYYKQSVIEKYFDWGYLDLPDSKFSAADRLQAGQWLCRDFYLGNYNNMQSIQLGKIPTGLRIGRDDALYYRDSYIQAMKAIPSEFWPYVRKVCIEDKDLKPDKKIISTSLLSKQNSYHQKMLLCLGLERLVKFYLQKNKKSS